MKANSKLKKKNCRLRNKLKYPQENLPNYEFRNTLDILCRAANDYGNQPSPTLPGDGHDIDIDENLEKMGIQNKQEPLEILELKSLENQTSIGDTWVEEIRRLREEMDILQKSHDNEHVKAYEASWVVNDLELILSS